MLNLGAAAGRTGAVSPAEAVPGEAVPAEAVPGATVQVTVALGKPVALGLIRGQMDWMPGCGHDASSARLAEPVGVKMNPSMNLAPL